MIEGEQYTLYIGAGFCEKVPSVYLVDAGDAAPESGSCIVDGIESEKKLLLRYGYLKEAWIWDKVLRTITLVLVWLLAAYLTQTIHRRKEVIRKSFIEKKQLYFSIENCHNKILSALVEVQLAYVIIEGSGIGFQTATRIAMYTLSFLAGYQIECARQFIKKNFPKHPFVFIILLLFAGFSLVGNRIFIYPLSIKVSIMGILIYVVSLCWIAPILSLLLSWYCNLVPVENPISGRVKFCIVTAGLLLIPAFYALYAFNPGITGSDTVSCMAIAAHHIRNMENWHPPFYCMLLKAIMLLWDSTYAIILVQFFFWVYVWLEGFLFLRKRGINEKVLLGAAFLIGINPSSYLHLCTIWKDIPYALSLLWLTIIIARLVLDREIRLKWYIYLELIVSLVFTFFIRQNGMVVYAVSLAFLASVLRKNVKLIIVIIASVIIIMAVQFPLYTYINVQDSADGHYAGGQYIGLGQDILGVYYSDGTLSEESMDIVHVLTNYNDGTHPYSPYWAKSFYGLDVSLTEFVNCYLDTFLKNPVIMTRAVICRNDCIWDVFGGAGTMEQEFVPDVPGQVNYVGTADNRDEWRAYYPKRESNYFTYSMTRFQLNFLENQLLNIFAWRTGIYTLLTAAAISAVFIRGNRLRVILVFVPCAGQIISLILSSGWADFRYYWPLNIMTVFLILLVPTMRSEHYEKEEE